MMFQVTSTSRIFSTSVIQREVIHAHGQTGSNQKSTVVRAVVVSLIPPLKPDDRRRHETSSVRPGHGGAAAGRTPVWHLARVLAAPMPDSGHRGAGIGELLALLAVGTLDVGPLAGVVLLHVRTGELVVVGSDVFDGLGRVLGEILRLGRLLARAGRLAHAGTS